MFQHRVEIIADVERIHQFAACLVGQILIFSHHRPDTLFQR
jgi:hypothetical protein